MAPTAATRSVGMGNQPRGHHEPTMEPPRSHSYRATADPEPRSHHGPRATEPSRGHGRTAMEPPRTHSYGTTTDPEPRSHHGSTAMEPPRTHSHRATKGHGRTATNSPQTHSYRPTMGPRTHSYRPTMGPWMHRYVPTTDHHEPTDPWLRTHHRPMVTATDPSAPWNHPWTHHRPTATTGPWTHGYVPTMDPRSQLQTPQCLEPTHGSTTYPRPRLHQEPMTVAPATMTGATVTETPMDRDPQPLP